jgi:hypothetical protein
MMKEPDKRKIALFVRKIRLHDPPEDAAYWRTQPYSFRLEALEQLRREYHLWKYHAEPGFQRVYTIIKR